MAGPLTRFWPVGQVLARFVALGCEVRIAEPTVRLADGDNFSVRYLLRPATGDFVPLVDLADDDRVSEVELAFWERRLGLTIQRPGPH